MTTKRFEDADRELSAFYGEIAESQPSVGAEPFRWSFAEVAPLMTRANDSVHPMLWFDGLDIPLVRGLDADFFEPGPMPEPSGLPAATFRSPWAGTDAVLESSLHAPTGVATMRYVAADDHSDVTPTMRCQIHRLVAGGSCTQRAHVGSSVFLVHAGSGAVEITGGRAGTMKARSAEGDVVAVPTSVEATWSAEDGLDLLEMSDAPVIEALGFQRTAG